MRAVHGPFASATATLMNNFKMFNYLFFSMKNFATIFNPPLCKKLADMMVVPVEFPKKGNYRLSSFNKVVLPQVNHVYLFYKDDNNQLLKYKNFHLQFYFNFFM
jgi:hypothetical protein